MGVHGLWKILEPTADPVKLETLRGKTLAIDASIWIYHFLKAMRDPKGTVLIAAHIIGFFRRICKLMFFEIKPVFVFDGAPPMLKKQTTSKRSERRIGREQSARSTANKLLTIQLQRAAQQKHAAPVEPSPDSVKVVGTVPKGAVYFDDLVGPDPSGARSGPTAGPSTAPPAGASQRFVPTDQYHLPEMGRIGPVRSNDQRLLSEEELEEYAKQFTSQARAGFIDTSLVDFRSREFEMMPLETQYQLLNMARMKSRLRMGYTAEELNRMFPDQMEFSRFQISRVTQRNFFTQKLMNLVGLEEDLTRRVSSEKDKEYFLKKTDQGWSLSLEDRHGSTPPAELAPAKGEPHEDEPQVERAEKKEATDSDSEAEFEDVDISAEPRLSPSEVDSNLSKGDSQIIDELFGFEAKLTREQLYDKLLYNMDSDEDDTEAPKKPQGGAARSMLFGKSAKETAEENAKSEKSASEATPSEAGRPASKPSAPPVPWFEEQGNFQEMQIKDRQVDNFVPLDYQSEDSEDDLEEVDVGPAEAPIAQYAVDTHSAEDPAVERLSAEETPSEVPQFTDHRTEEQVIEGPGVDVGETKREASVIEENGHEAPVLKEPVMEEPVEPVMEEPVEPVMEEPVEPVIEESFVEEEPVLEDPRVEGAVAEKTRDAESSAAQPQKTTRDRPTEQHVPGAEPKIMKGAPEIRKDSNKGTHKAHMKEPDMEPASYAPEESTSGDTGEVQPEDAVEPDIELTPEAAERAEADAKEAEEEDEDIAGMLIAEAEENERFARELADQNHQTWSQANEREYQTQIKNLRSQFAQQSRDADNISTEMVQECQELLQLFGIPYITAPAEAEAQCAELHALKLVDGVVTDDGDTFLFDSNARVYRNMFSQAKFVEFYSTKRIRERLGLDRRSMIDLAFLLGSDYTDGILGIGPVTGVEILAEFGDLKHFAQWWEEAQRFPENADIGTPLRRRLLKSFQKKLYLPDDFPNPVVVDAYLHPSVDKDSEKFDWGSPDLEGLRQFMETTAGWDHSKTDATLLPVVQEAKRRDLLAKTERAMNQSRLDDYYRTVVQNPALGSKRAAKAAGLMRKKQKH